MKTPALGFFGRQVGRDIAMHVAIALGAAVTLFITIDSVEAVNRALSRATVTDMVRLQVWNVPAVLQQFAAFCALLGAMNAIAALLRRGEVVAMLSAGASPAIILKPALFGGLLIGMLHAAMTEYVAPDARAEVSAARRRLGLPAQSTDSIDTSLAWFRSGDRMYRIGALEDPNGLVLGGVLILRIENGRLAERWDVDRMRYTSDGWIAEKLLHRRFEGRDAIHTVRIPSAKIEIAEQPKDFVSRIGAPERLHFRALYEATETRERLGQPSTVHHIELYRRVAQPLSIALAVVLGAALAFFSGRRPSIAAALGLGAVFGFVLWLADEIGLALGTAGAIGPFLAAIAMPVLLIGAAAATWVIAERRGIRTR
jgi:lipopolysaccharide export system permease protein